jgi:hypothetical protein
MPQVECRGCGRSIHAEAIRCAQCGARNLTDPTPFMSVALFVLILLLLVL